MIKQHYLQQMGIQAWQLRTANHAVPDNTPIWESLKQEVAQCTLCGLEKSRTQTVFGVGNRNADLLIIGEAPGFYEDQQGEPFVGRAGKLLNEMLAAIGSARSEVFIANILKCRPPNNRDPEPREVELCTPYLERQIALLKPRLILALGRIAGHYLLKTKLPLGRLRGSIHQLSPLNIPLIVTYHPAYLLRNPRDKAKAYSDLCFAAKTLGELKNSNF